MTLMMMGRLNKNFFPIIKINDNQFIYVMDYAENESNTHIETFYTFTEYTVLDYDESKIDRDFKQDLSFLLEILKKDMYNELLDEEEKKNDN